MWQLRRRPQNLPTLVMLSTGVGVYNKPPCNQLLCVKTERIGYKLKISVTEQIPSPSRLLEALGMEMKSAVQPLSPVLLLMAGVVGVKER